jgi:hypothetical protein
MCINAVTCTHFITILANKAACHNALCNVATLHLVVPHFLVILRSIRRLIQFSVYRLYDLSVENFECSKFPPGEGGGGGF